MDSRAALLSKATLLSTSCASARKALRIMVNNMDQQLYRRFADDRPEFRQPFVQRLMCRRTELTIAKCRIASRANQFPKRVEVRLCSRRTT